MTSDTRLAFAHPSERAAATAGPEPLDRISLRDHIVEVEIGAFQAERGVTQRICFNVVVEVQPLTGPVDDDVDRILSYDRVTEAIAYELSDEKRDRGPGALGVEIVRARDDTPDSQAEAREVPHPELVYLSNDAIASPHLAGWLDQLHQMGRPLILCVGASDTAAPQVGHKMAQRRIDLLAIEQNAWVLAAKDDRCVVVATRTELDWAMKNGQTSVWAPSKIVLDSVDTPSAQPRDAVALAAWFAASFDATEMLVIGADLPADASVPLRAVAVDQGRL